MKLRAVLPPVIFISAAFLIYLPVLDRYFVSDDFKVLNRVCMERIIFISGFFRPLSDLTILMNYKLGGLNPIVFNSFNILIHGINAYLLYQVCLCLENFGDKSQKNQFSVFSAVLFLCYPFHNEAVVWLLGRGASMACMFALLSLIGYYKIKKESWQVIVVCGFYFISLSAFESTLFFPLIFILILLLKNENVRQIRKWTIIMTGTLCLHLIIRYRIAGSILGSYGQEFFHFKMKAYILNISKTGGRLLLPPSGSALIMVSLFAILLGGIIFIIRKNRLKIIYSLTGRTIIYLTGMLFISCIIPVIIGISTQTSETDRLLYLPSVFLCMITGLLLLICIESKGWRLFYLMLIIAYNLFFLEKNNLNWKKASQITYSIVEKIQSEKSAAKIYFLNIPNEIDGAYVFRQGFTEALRLYGKDSSHFVVVNYLPRQDLEKMKEKIKFDNDKAVSVLPPDIVLNRDSSGCRQVYDHGKLKFISQADDRIYFWNIDQLDAIKSCQYQHPG